MTDNRTNEPNKYAGFIARQIHQRERGLRGIGAKCLCGKLFDLDANHALHQVEAILEAAANVAPIQYTDRDVALEYAGRLADENKDLLGRLTGEDPKVPSIVDKIAEVIQRLKFNEEGCRDGDIDCTEAVSDHAEQIARAVVEAIGGERRGE